MSVKLSETQVEFYTDVMRDATNEELWQAATGDDVYAHFARKELVARDRGNKPLERNYQDRD
jgi:hypothetical protein